MTKLMLIVAAPLLITGAAFAQDAEPQAVPSVGPPVNKAYAAEQAEADAKAAASARDEEEERASRDGEGDEDDREVIVTGTESGEEFRYKIPESVTYRPEKEEPKEKATSRGMNCEVDEMGQPISNTDIELGTYNLARCK